MLCSFHLYLLYVSLYPSTFWKVVFKSAKSYSFCFSKEERYRTYIGMVYHLYFSFPKQSFIEHFTAISEVCFKNI